MLDTITHPVTFDAKPTIRETAAQRQLFSQIRNAERSFSVQLRKVAKHIGDLVHGMQPYDAGKIDTLRRMLEQYSYILRPWATAVSRRMLADVERRDRRAWAEHTKALGYGLQQEIFNAPMGEKFQELMENQVHLITSLPTEAAQRVHDIVIGNMITGERAEELSKKIMETGNVTKARANTIARTETSRAATALTQVRAEYIGSPGYIWHNARDYKVRPELGIKHFAELNTLAMGSHRKLEGTFHKWTEPPIADPTGIRAHPGSIWNCRCYPEPVLGSAY